MVEDQKTREVVVEWQGKALKAQSNGVVHGIGLHHVASGVANLLV